MYRRVSIRGGSLVPQGVHSVAAKQANLSSPPPLSSVQHTFRAASWRHAITADAASPTTYSGTRPTQQTPSTKKEVPAFVSSFRLALPKFTTLSTPSFMSAANPDRRSRNSVIDDTKKRELLLEEKRMISGLLGQTSERGMPDYSMSAFQKCLRRQAGKSSNPVSAPTSTENSSSSTQMSKEACAARGDDMRGTSGDLERVPDSTYALREKYVAPLDGNYSTFNALVGSNVVLLYFYAFWGDAFCTVTPSVVSLMDNINATLREEAIGAGKQQHNAKPVKLAMVNMDLHEHLSALHDLRSVPTFVIYANGSIVGRFEGTILDTVSAKIKEVVASL